MLMFAKEGHGFFLIDDVQDDSTLLSGFLWPINGNSDNNFEPFCTFRFHKRQALS